MIHLTEHDLQQLARRATDAGAPNVAEGACLALRLVHWTDTHSDGWAYWAPPRKAAQRLLRLLEDWDWAWLNARAGDIDISDADLARARAIISRFLTRQVAAGRMSEAEKVEVLTGEAPNVTIVATFNVKPSDVITLVDTLTLNLGGTVEKVVR